MKIIMAAFLLALPSFAGPSGVQSFKLQNGLRVQLIENHQHPLVRLQLRAVWAPLETITPPPVVEPGGKAPIQRPKNQMAFEPLALGVLEKCSVGHRNRAAFNRAVEERGLSLRLSGDPDGPTWHLSGGSPEVESAFSLLADASTRPIPEGGDLDAVKSRLIDELHESGMQEGARINFLRLLIRPDLALEPITESSLGQIYLVDIQRHITKTLRPGRAVLAISGDLNLSQARQLAQANFGTWNEGSEWSDKPADVVPRPTSSTAEVLVRPPMIVPSERAETSIALPFHALDERQRAAMELLSLWLPRGLGSERCLIQFGAAQWRSLILTGDGSEASLREALVAAKANGLKPSDLEQAKALWIAGRRALALHPQEQLSFASKESLLGPEPSEQEIQSVDLATFNATLQSWLNLNSARILILGGDQAPAPKAN